MRKEMQPAGQQPLGFWALRTGEAIRARTRGRLAELDVTQPEWWVLHQLSMHPTGMSQDRIVSFVGPNESDDSIVRAIAAGIDKGWLERSGDHIRLTDRHGISDRDYATTIEVLQRTMTNLGSDAWHC